MHNPTIYRAVFSGLIMTAFGKEQTLKFRTEIEMYQARDMPELWRARPAIETGRHKWEASSPVELARIIEGDFVERETTWLIHHHQPPQLRRPRPANVIEMPQRKVS